MNEKTIRVGEPWPFGNEPSMDATGLSIDEGGLMFKLWCAPPLEWERRLLDGLCTHTGIYTPLHMPLFVFDDSKVVTMSDGTSLLNPDGLGEGVFVIRAPLCCPVENVKKWVQSNSKEVRFILLERGSQIVRRTRIVYVSEDYRERLAGAWLSLAHPMERNPLIPENQMLLNASALWEFHAQTQSFKWVREGLRSVGANP